MKQAEIGNTQIRCRHCFQSELDHVNGKKCMYASSIYEPWRCQSSQCKHDGLLRMCDPVMRLRDGRHVHEHCTWTVQERYQWEAVYG
jgi:hypothetical protein